MVVKLAEALKIRMPCKAAFYRHISCLGYYACRESGSYANLDIGHSGCEFPASGGSGILSQNLTLCAGHKYNLLYVTLKFYLVSNAYQQLHDTDA